MTWWNLNQETALQHVEKTKSAQLAIIPQIRLLKLPPSSVYFASFVPANGGPPGSYYSALSIPTAECVNPEGEVFPCVMMHTEADMHDDPSFEEDKKPIDTFQ